jgi:hypothetical protein
MGQQRVKDKFEGQEWLWMLIIPATQEAEMEDHGSRPAQANNNNKKLGRPYVKNN